MGECRSNVASIDAFLAKRTGFTTIGKLCIAAHLVIRERPDHVMNEANDDHWYRHLWNVLVAGTDDVQDLGRNKIKFVTFNYDRSLEYFLHTAAKYTYGVNDDAAANALRRLEIRHVYGSLGTFHNAGLNGARAYTDDINPNGTYLSRLDKIINQLSMRGQLPCHQPAIQMQTCGQDGKEKYAVITTTRLLVILLKVINIFP